MAIQTIPGLTGFLYGRVSSMDKRAIGKLTASNHLESFHAAKPADYDKKIISLYTQSSLYSNDFLEMINKSDPFYIDGISDSWKWDVQVPYKFPKIIEIPTSTQNLAKPGIDGQELELVLDTNEFSKNNIICIGHRQFGPNLEVIADPLPHNAGFRYKLVLYSENPTVEYVDPRFLKVGNEIHLIGSSIGEFDQDLPGLPRLGEKLTMFESLGSGYGYSHQVTDWADAKMLRDSSGKPLDILVYADARRNQMPQSRNDLKWEPFVEFLMRKQMLETKVQKMVWGKPGSSRTGGSSHEVKRTSAGIYHRMRHSGNYVPYNKGEFSANLIRAVFGDLFYRRVDVKDRKVVLFTNEAGFDVFQQAIKQDALNSGLTLVADSGNRYIQGQGQNLTYNWAFSSFITRETGEVTLKHLKELDLPQTNMEFGQNKKSTPVFFVFDVSNTNGGSLANNIREVRLKSRPSMTWGYIDGTAHHLGFARSQGMSSANKFPGYELWMKDRCDVFIEDPTKTVLIEEVPAF